jgi:shikimate dehydrogenase
MTTAQDVAAIQACLNNDVGAEWVRDRRIAGVIGTAPSRYSKSPALWNAAFAFLHMNAAYLPFDIEASKLGPLMATIRSAESVLGINVTVPHKLAIMDYLDELDSGAARIHAVNTVVRTQDGRLIGYNTDGAGFVHSISKLQPGQTESFLPSLHRTEVLLLGAGGSARAVAFHMGEFLDGGKLVICNRTVEHARALAAEIRVAGYDTIAIGEDALAQWAPRMTLIINSTTKGQGSSSLELYSALAPVSPRHASAEAVQPAITTNNEESLRLAALIPRDTRFYDLIYHPEETVFLQHARATGHKTMNGKAMIISQAALAFANHVCAEELRARKLDKLETLNSLVEVMYEAW